jgi:xylan 1,4-beta-xylosidase
MSYWTYTDLFEEPGPPPTPFHGGFGLINREGIRKPAWFAYKYLSELSGREIPTSDPQSWASTDGSKTTAIIWDWVRPDQPTSDRPFFTKILPVEPAAPVRVSFARLRPGTYRLEVRRTGFRANDPQTAYLEMGSPKALTAGQLRRLQALTRDRPRQDRIVRVPRNGSFGIALPMRSNDVLLIDLRAVGRER